MTEKNVAELDPNEAELDRIHQSSSLAELEDLRVQLLGKSGTITALLKTLGGMTPEERTSQGPRIHTLREAVTEALASRKSGLERAALDARLANETLDMTLP